MSPVAYTWGPFSAKIFLKIWFCKIDPLLPPHIDFNTIPYFTYGYPYRGVKEGKLKKGGVQRGGGIEAGRRKRLSLSDEPKPSPCLVVLQRNDNEYLSDTTDAFCCLDKSVQPAKIEYTLRKFCL